MQKAESFFCRNIILHGQAAVCEIQQDNPRQFRAAYEIQVSREIDPADRLQFAEHTFGLSIAVHVLDVKFQYR